MPAELPGHRRRATGEEVDGALVRAAWCAGAFEILAAVATVPGATIAERDLAREVNDGSGFSSREGWGRWLGPVLVRVAIDCAADRRPLLPSLCVGDDGRVTRRYAVAVERAGRVRPRDLQAHAAAERLACHRAFGGLDLPDDWHPEVAVGGAPSRRASCPGCHLRLPASGVCDTCS